MNPYTVCLVWTIYHKNASIFVSDVLAELNYAIRKFEGENSETLMCRLEDCVFYTSGLTMIMFHADSLLKLATESIDRLFEKVVYSHWNPKRIEYLKLLSRKIGIVHPLYEYYSLKLYHMQTAFYLLFMGCCLSAFCFNAEVLYYLVLSPRT